MHVGGQGFDSLTVHMRYYVYIIYNIENDKFYIGQTNNLKYRLARHNNGKSKYTSNYNGKWILVYKEEFVSRTKAIAREKFLKRQKNKDFYKKLCKSQFSLASPKSSGCTYAAHIKAP